MSCGVHVSCLSHPACSLLNIVLITKKFMKKKTFSNENVYTWKQTCGSDHYLIIACKNKIYSRYLSEKEQLSNSI